MNDETPVNAQPAQEEVDGGVLDTVKAIAKAVVGFDDDLMAIIEKKALSAINESGIADAILNIDVNDVQQVANALSGGLAPIMKAATAIMSVLGKVIPGPIASVLGCDRLNNAMVEIGDLIGRVNDRELKNKQFRAAYGELHGQTMEAKSKVHTV